MPIEKAKYVYYQATTKSRPGEKPGYRYGLPVEVSREAGLTEGEKRWRSGKRFMTVEEAVAARDEHLEELGALHYISDEPVSVDDTPEFNESPDGMSGNLTIKTGRISTPEELLHRAQIDPDVWEVERQVVNSWDMTNKDGEAYQNFQIKLWLKRKVPVLDVEYLKELLKGMKKARRVPKTNPTGNHLLEINICDLHLGKLCWAGETGEDFDLKIAKQRFMKAVTELSSTTVAFPIEKIVFPVGSDFFQSDNYQNTTTKGTPLDVDGRFPKIFEEGVSVLIWAVEHLRQYAPVDVVFIPGNHDRQSGFCASYAMHLYFQNCHDVTVDYSPNPRKYVRYHNNMLGLFHGDDISPKDVFKVAATECRFWSDVEFREMHGGHYHHECVKEEAGLVVRYLGSYSGTDFWHHLRGYIGSRKSGHAFVYSQQLGVVSHLTCSVTP